MATNPTETREQMADRLDVMGQQELLIPHDDSNVAYAALKAGAAALRAPERGTWQPIETAPRDRRVILFVPDEHPSCYSRQIGQWLCEDAGWRYDDDPSGNYSPAHPPSMWMPMPDPPVTLKEPS